MYFISKRAEQFLLGLVRKYAEDMYEKAYEEGRRSGYKQGKQDGYLDGLRDSSKETLVLNTNGLVMINQKSP